MTPLGPRQPGVRVGAALYLRPLCPASPPPQRPLAVPGAGDEDVAPPRPASPPP